MARIPAPPHTSPQHRLLTVTAAVVGAALVLLVVFQNVGVALFGTRGAEVGSRAFLVGQVANALGLATAIFLGSFLAGQLRTLLRLREDGERQRRLLDALAGELALGLRAAPAGAYRDPVRLTLLARVLEVGLGDGADREFVAALLALQIAVARYNDLILTNAVILVNGDDGALRDTVERYWRDLAQAIADVRRLLPAP